MVDRQQDSVGASASEERWVFDQNGNGFMLNRGAVGVLVWNEARWGIWRWSLRRRGEDGTWRMTRLPGEGGEAPSMEDAKAAALECLIHRGCG